MTVQSTTRRNDYIGNGATATYTFTFRIFAATDLLVTTKDTDGLETPLTYPTDYSVTGVGLYSGGSITLTAGALETNYRITIRRLLPLTQGADIRNQGGYYPDVVENALDRLDMIALQHQDEIDRAIKLPETESSAVILPTLENRASKFLAFDAAGVPIAAAGTSANLGPVSTFINAMLDDANAASARMTLEEGDLPARFYPHQAPTPNLTVLIDAGKIIKADGTLVSQTQQAATFVAPTANPRIDRIVVDMLTGAYSIIAGTEAASPAAPAITAGKLPCAQVSLIVGQTQITNANITDERTAYCQYKANPAQMEIGTLASGVIVPLSRIQKFSGSSKNTSTLTINSAGTNIAPFINCGAVAVGDIVQVGLYAVVRKDATAGTCQMRLLPSGVTIAALNDLTEIARHFYVAASFVHKEYFFAEFVVTSAGTLSVTGLVYSHNGAGSLEPNEGQLIARVLRA